MKKLLLVVLVSVLVACATIGLTGCFFGRSGERMLFEIRTDELPNIERWECCCFYHIGGYVIHETTTYKLIIVREFVILEIVELNYRVRFPVPSGLLWIQRDFSSSGTHHTIGSSALPNLNYIWHHNDWSATDEPLTLTIRGWRA